MLEELYFRRVFSVNPFRTLSLPMGEMSFYKDWTDGRRGDPYPVLASDGETTEEVGDGRYRLLSRTGGSVTRLIGGFFPWNTYDFSVSRLERGTVSLVIPCAAEEGGPVSVTLDADGGIALKAGEISLAGALEPGEGWAFSVSFRTNGLTVLDRRKKGRAATVFDADLPVLAGMRREAVFSRTGAELAVMLDAGGEAILTEVRASLVSGMSHADPKPIRYEDGTVMTEGGRIFLTVSARNASGSYQNVLSWMPGTSDFRMEGALFFDCGDGIWCGDVASSILYDRRAGRWLLWVCAFSHGHRLARASFTNDPRYGVSVIDVRPMEYGAGDPDGFEAFSGDEDPDLIFTGGKWHLAVCRLGADGGYHYLHFVSDDPLDGFTFVDKTEGKEKTGGLFVKCGTGVEFVCGSDFGKRAVYDVYPLDGFGREPGHLQCDHDDGGFRGWGTVMYLPCGTRYRYVWLTFDRHNSSDYNWSYGNLYIYETETRKEGGTL